MAFPLQVQASGPGEIRLVVPGGFLDPIELREVSPFRFARPGGDEQAVFRAEDGAPAGLLFLGAFGLPFAFERLAGWHEPPRQLAALAAGSALALSALVGWPLAAWRRRRAGREAPPPLARLATASASWRAAAGWP